MVTKRIAEYLFRRWNIDTDSHMSTAETLGELGVLIILRDAGTVGHLVWVLGGVAAEGSAQLFDGGGVVVVRDAGDELVAGHRSVFGVIDDVDLAQVPEVASWGVGRHRHKASAVLGN